MEDFNCSQNNLSIPIPEEILFMLPEYKFLFSYPRETLIIFFLEKNKFDKKFLLTLFDWHN